MYTPRATQSSLATNSPVPGMEWFRRHVFIIGITNFLQDFSNSHKGREKEGVAGILHPESAEEEAVHDDQDAAPSEDSNALGFRIDNPGDLDSQRDSREGEDTIWSRLVVHQMT